MNFKEALREARDDTRSVPGHRHYLKKNVSDAEAFIDTGAPIYMFALL